MKKLILITSILFTVACFAQEDKIVTLTVSGTGKTIEEAQTNALRSAIEQAFGVFITSKTEILNDNLIKDEIVSVASGNVIKYDIISQVEAPSVGYAITLNATLSISKLTSFAESKGVVVEFNGGMFAANLKLQKLNEINELKTITNLFGIMHEGLQNAFDYELKTSEQPKLNSNLNLFGIDFFVSVLGNKNYNNLMGYLIESIIKLNMSSDDIKIYNSLNKKLFKLDIPINGQIKEFNFRNENSLKILYCIFSNLQNFYMSNFEISDGIGNVFFGPATKNQTDVSNWSSYVEKTNVEKFLKIPFFIGGPISQPNGEIDSKTKIETGEVIYKWTLFYTQQELEKIRSFTVKSSGVKSKFKYGGFLIYEDTEKAIICPPYVIDLSKIEPENKEAKMSIENNQMTSSELFSAKQNTAMISNRYKNDIGSRLLEYNNQNLTNWYIPSKKEVVLVCEKLLAFSLNCEEYISSTDNPQYGRITNYVLALRENVIYNALIKDVFINNPTKWQYINFKEFKIKDDIHFDKIYINDNNANEIWEVLPISYIKLN